MIRSLQFSARPPSPENGEMGWRLRSWSVMPMWRSLHKLTRNVGSESFQVGAQGRPERVAPLGRVQSSMLLPQTSPCAALPSGCYCPILLYQISILVREWFSWVLELLLLVNQTWEGSHGHFRPITRWWEAQVTTWTCEWHLNKGKVLWKPTLICSV